MAGNNSGNNNSGTPVVPPNPYLSGAGAGVLPGSLQDPSLGSATINPYNWQQNIGRLVPGTSKNGKPQTAGAVIENIMQAAEADPSIVLPLQQQLIMAGFLNPHKSQTFEPGAITAGDETYNALGKLATTAATTGKDYQSILDDRTGRKVGAAQYDFYVHRYGTDGTGGGIRKFTTSATTISTPLAAQDILRTTYQKYEGRDPSASETAAFTEALQQAQQQNPTQMTGSYDPAMGYYHADRSMTTTGGMDPNAVAAFAQNFATTGANQQGANEHSVHTYTDMFEQSLQSLGAKP